MNKILVLFFTVLTLASCGDKFNIKGSSDISPIDGQKLYLKLIGNDESTIIDSCEVIHGTFNFDGRVDTTQLAGVFVGDEQLLVFVLDNSEIGIKINRNGTKVSGISLNDSLTNFFKEMDSFSFRVDELNDKRNLAIMDGLDIDAVNDNLVSELMKINAEQSERVTRFIKNNYDNLLGPAIFKMVISKQYAAPILDNWIEGIMIEATDKFKNDVFVKDFYAKAQENQEILNGMRTPTSEEPTIEE